MSISAQTGKIIKKRSGHVKNLEKMKTNMKQVSQCVDDLRKIQQELNIVNITDEMKQMAKLIQSIQTDTFFTQYTEYCNELNRLLERLSRKSLNISLIGNRGAGKSKLLQRITGLGEDVIPSASGGDCTGAQSIIINTDIPSAKADIEFYSEVEIIQIVNNYLQEITDGKESIGSIKELVNLDCDRIKKALTSATKQDYLETLQKYVDHFSDYSEKLGKMDRNVPADKIEQYVAQYSCHDKEKKYFTFLGVKLATIHCRFPRKDVGNIVLVDTVGLGAMALGVEEACKKAVKNDSDAILYVNMTAKRDSLNKEERIRINDFISSEVSPEYTKEMLFVILNHCRGMNDAVINDITDNTKKAIANGELYAADAMKVDCSSEEEVNDNLLIPVLNRLIDRIGIVDNRLLVHLNELGKKLYSEYEKICNAVEQAFVHSASDDIKRDFAPLIMETIGTKLLNNIRDLYLKVYSAKRTLPCYEMTSAAEECISRILAHVPPEEDIISLLNYGGINQINAYEKCTNKMRMDIINDFNGLNLILDSVVEKMKLEVLHMLTDEDKGRLCFVYALEDRTSSEWISGFLKETKAEQKYQQIAYALRQFDKYTINVQGFLIHEVRNQLDILDISLSPIPPISQDLLQKETIAAEINGWLSTYAVETRNKILDVLNGLFIAPNRSMFAAIKDFYDRVTYSSSGNEADTVLTEWRYLYEDWIPVIWKKEYENISSINETLAQWNEILEKLTAWKKEEFFTVDSF